MEGVGWDIEDEEWGMADGRSRRMEDGRDYLVHKLLTIVER